MAKHENLSIKIDYLSVVLNTLKASEFITRFLKVPLEYFSVQDGKVKYKDYTKLYQFGNIKVFGDSIPTDINRDGLGCYLVLSGKGCDEFHSWLMGSDMNYQSFFQELSSLGINNFHITRIDIAIDDRNNLPYFTMEQIKRKCLKNEFISTCNNYRFAESSFLNDTAKTVYIGDTKSSISFRFYDKDKEQAMKLQEPYNPLESWKRTEIQLRNDKANGVVQTLMGSSMELGQLTFDLIGSNLRFLVKDNAQKNKSRWKTCDFWIRYLGNIEPLRIGKECPSNSLVETQEWLANGGAVSAITAFAFLQEHNALGELKSVAMLMSKARYSTDLSGKIVSHLQEIGRLELIPLVYENTRNIEK